MKKILATIAMLAIPGIAMSAGLIGDCYDCHTMHNSENGGQQVAQIAGGALSPTPIENLLKFDCIACHANDPTGNDGIWAPSGALGGSEIPQVAHGGTTDLAGGNFSYGLGANGTSDKVHNVSELFSGQVEAIAPADGNPPGMFQTGGHNGVFTTTTNYDNFSCAGARGCHGTRNQEIGNGTGNVPRVGMAAIAGAHHINTEGVKMGANPVDGQVHSGASVAAGYRFIPGLWGYGNETNRWQNIDGDNHNEYYGNVTTDIANSCATCHAGFATTQALDSNIQVPNNSMSGFCSTCHGVFHSSGGGDLDNNGVSSAFLRHPSDYVLYAAGSGAASAEYAAYVAYDISAPVARQDISAFGGTDGNVLVDPTQDMVMCLSCHAAHGTPYDYLLRFDYNAMTAGNYADLNAVDADGNGGDGCLACHTAKGIIQ